MSKTILKEKLILNFISQEGITLFNIRNDVPDPDLPTHLTPIGLGKGKKIS